MDKITIGQDLLIILFKNKIIKSLTNFNFRDQAMISLIKTMITMGYKNNDILELIDKNMNLLSILEFHQDLVIDKQYECNYLLNKLKKMIEEIKRENNEIYN